LHPVQDPARLGWTPVTQVAHYHVDAASLLAAAPTVEKS